LILLAGCGPPPDDKTVSSNALEQAIQTGDASRVKNSSDLLDAAKSMFETLQLSAQTADPFDAMQKAKLTDWSNGVGIYVQIMMSAQDAGVLENGWHLLARLHLMEREFSAAKKDTAAWLAKRTSLGFGQYSYDEIKMITNNDWLVNAISLVTQRDHRDYLKMWGLGFSTKADTQVGSFSYPVVARKYYVSDGKDYCKGLDKTAVSIDGTTTWPLMP
jgi:hypothetical protein